MSQSLRTNFQQVGQIPALDKWLGKNPYWPLWIYKFDDFSVAAGFAFERFMERMQNPELNKDNKDFLNGFLQAKQEFPDSVSDHDIIGYMIINVGHLEPFPMYSTSEPSKYRNTYALV